jgi:hypothetical protein
MVSAFSLSAFKTPILSETLAPPQMTTNGLAGFSRPSQVFQLFVIKSPIADSAECDAHGGRMRAVRGAKCVVHVKSPKSASPLANSGSLLSPAGIERFPAEHAVLICAPTIWWGPSDSVVTEMTMMMSDAIFTDRPK